MKNLLSAIIFSLVTLATFQNCSNTNSASKETSASDKEKLTQEIQSLEDTLKAKADQKIDRNLAMDLIKKSVVFCQAYPEDDLTPAYLFRAGNVAVGIGSFEEAISYFGQIHKKHQSYERAPDALFLEGFTYENHLKNLEKAKKSYDLFLKQYPDNQLADQVRVVLENMGKTPEELVKSFQNK